MKFLDMYNTYGKTPTQTERYVLFKYHSKNNEKSMI